MHQKDVNKTRLPVAKWKEDVRLKNLPLPKTVEGANKFPHSVLVGIGSKMENEVIAAVQVYDSQLVRVARHTYTRDLQMK